MVRTKDYQSGFQFPDVEEESPRSKPLFLGSPSKGLNYLLKPSELDSKETPYLLNGRICRNLLEPRPGTTLIYDTPALIDAWKQISFFEANETWTSIIGVTQDGTYHRTDEETGDSLLALKLLTELSAGEYLSYGYRVILPPLDLTLLAPGIDSIDDDYICFYTYHDTRANIQSIMISLSSLTGGSFRCTLSQTDFTAGDNQETLFRIRKRDFTKHDSPLWSDIWHITISAISVSGTVLTLYLDKLQLEADSSRGFYGSIMHIGEFRLSDNISYTIIITTKSIYYSCDNIKFTNIPYYVSGVLTYFSGTTKDRFWAVSAPDAEYFIFCNGKDPVLYLNSNLDEVRELTSYSSKYGFIFGNRLMIAHLTDLPTQLRWCVAGSGPAHYIDWTGTGSGYKNFTDSGEEITGCGKLFETGLIYQKDCINHITRTGQSESPFDFKARLGTGLYIPGSLIQLKDFHVFWGEDNAYVYDLNSLTEVGNNIKDQFLSNINVNYLDTVHTVIDPNYDEAQLYYPSLGAISPDKVLVFNYAMKIFTSEWSLSAAASGRVSDQTSQSWEDLTDIWGNLSETWEEFIVKSRPIIAIGNGYALSKQDSSIATDNMSEFSFEFWTKDFRDDHNKRLVSFRHIIDYYSSQAAILRVALSGDGGISWTSDMEVTLSSSLSSKLNRALFHFIQTYDSVMLRIRCNSGHRFQISRQTLEAQTSGDIDE